MTSNENSSHYAIPHYIVLVNFSLLTEAIEVLSSANITDFVVSKFEETPIMWLDVTGELPSTIVSILGYIGCDAVVPIMRLPVPQVSPFTERQITIVKLTADEGLTTDRIARRLKLSEDTIKREFRKISRSLRIGSEGINGNELRNMRGPIILTFLQNRWIQ